MPIHVIAEASHSNASVRVMLNKAMPLITAEKKDVLFALEQRANQSLKSLVERLKSEIGQVHDYIKASKARGEDIYDSNYVEPIYGLVKLFSLEQLLKLLELPDMAYKGIDLDIGQGRARQSYDEVDRLAIQTSAFRSEIMAYNLVRIYFENPARTTVALVGGHHLEAIKQHIIQLVGHEEARNFKFSILTNTQPLPLPNDMPVHTQKKARYVMKTHASSFFDTTTPEQLEQKGIGIFHDSNPNVHKDFVKEATKENEYSNNHRSKALAMYYRAICFEENRCIHPKEKDALLKILEEAFKVNSASLTSDKEEAIIAMIRCSLYKKNQELLGPKNWSALFGTLFCCKKYTAGTFGFRLQNDKHANSALTMDKVSKVLSNQRESVYSLR